MGLYIVAALPIWFYQPLTGRRVMAFLAYKFLVPMYIYAQVVTHDMPIYLNTYTEPILRIYNIHWGELGRYPNRYATVDHDKKETGSHLMFHSFRASVVLITVPGPIIIDFLIFREK